jgi:hypothetical protein
MKITKKTSLLAGVSVATAVSASIAMADQVFLDDVIVDGSLCAGFDCVNGESFGFDTIRMKENNVRLNFTDTSNSASFPTADWTLEANASSNGGGNYFAITQIDTGRTPFLVEGGAPTSALYVDDAGRVGFGTSSPVVEAHIIDGDTPTVRLEQDGSSGFTPQTFDIAANESNFFVRDVTNGSALPFKIIPGASHDTLTVAANGVGVGTKAQDTLLHVRSTDSALSVDQKGLLHVENASGSAAVRTMAVFENNGEVELSLYNADPSALTAEWKIASISGDLRLITPNSPGAEFALSKTGDVSILGNFISGGTTLTVPDYVFADDYELMPLEQVEAFILQESHLPKIPSAMDIKENGINMSEMQMALLEKVEELTLYTLDQQKLIAAQQESVASLQARIDALEN